MKNQSVLYETKEKTGIITLNRPDNRNSMDEETLTTFSEIIENVQKSKDLRCLIITGSGNSFCAGADFKQGFKGIGEMMINEVLMRAYKPFLKVGEVNIPTIAAMNGHAIGGGFGLALMCDIRIANEKAKYGANFARLGVHSGMAVSYILPRIIGLPMANELLFTGRLITGEKAAAIGLANYAVKEADVLQKAIELADEISKSAPVAVKMLKQSIYRGLTWNPVMAAEIESLCQGKTFEMEDSKEGISALLEKREPVFTGM